MDGVPTMPQRTNARGQSLSIIIVTHNSERFLSACLDSIFASKGLENVAEVLVVDNNSEDRSYDLARHYASASDKIQLLLSPFNLGFPAACNIGARNATGSYLLFLNPDAVLSGDFLQDVETILKDLDADVAVVQPKILSTNNILDSAGGIMDVFGHGAHIGKDKTDSLRYNKPQETFYACFACAIVRKGVFETLGGLDQTYFLYGEDLDFCWRAWLLGWRIVYLPQLVAYHRGQHSTRFVPYKAKCHARKNTLVSVIANYSSAMSFFAVTLLILLYLGGALRAHINGDRAESRAFLHPIWWVGKNLKYIHQKRQKIQARRKRSDRFLFKKGFITTRPLGLLLHLGGDDPLDG